MPRGAVPATWGISSRMQRQALRKSHQNAKATRALANYLIVNVADGVLRFLRMFAPVSNGLRTVIP
jgi:hypothetical protein